MAHFRAEINGVRGPASRLGSKATGIIGHLHGWNTGVKVEVTHNAETGKDYVRVYKTGGSNNTSGELIAEWSERDLVPKFYK